MTGKLKSWVIPGYGKFSGGEPLILQSAQETDKLSDTEPALCVTTVNVLTKEITFFSPWPPNGKSQLIGKEPLVAQTVKNLPAVQENRVQSLGWKDPLEKGMAIHSSILARKIPWTEQPGGLQFLGSQRVRYDWAANTLTHSSILAWRIQWTEEPGGLQSMGSQRVRHEWVTTAPLQLLRGDESWQPKDFVI